MKPMDKARQDLRGKLMIGGSLVIIAALLIAQGVFQAASSRVDPKSLCRTDRPLVGHTVVLVDVSDAMQAEEIRQLLIRVEAIRKGIPKDAMLSVFFVNESSSDVLSERFCKCNPGDGSDANPLWQGPAVIAKKWQTAFGAPLDSALREASHYSESNASPILEAIRYVTEHDDFTRSTTNRRLVIVSDMIQNSDRFTLYGGPRSFAEFSRTEAATELMPDLRDAEVEIEYLIRPRYRGLQNDKLKQFWQDYFARAGAKTPVTFRAVRGAYRAQNELKRPWQPGATSAVGQVGAAEPNPLMDQPSQDDSIAQESTIDGGTVDDTPLHAMSQGRAQVPNEQGPASNADATAATTELLAAGSAPIVGIREEVYVDEYPAILKQVPPVYSEEARAQGAQGTVTLRVLVGQDGRVHEIEILKGKTVLSTSAVEAVRKWEFKPGTVNGKPIPVWVTIPVTFRR